MNEARRALGPLPEPADAFAFGDSPRMADELLALVLAGVKTATCSWPAERSCEEGDLSVVLDDRGVPAALIRTAERRERPFLEVDAAFAHDEGEGDRTLAWWRDAHRRFFGRLTDLPRPFSDDETVLCERFELVYGRA